MTSLATLRIFSPTIFLMSDFSIVQKFDNL